MIRTLIACGLLLGGTNAPAQTLYRCVQAGKPTSFQNTPCGTTARTATAVDYVPDAEPSPARRAAATQAEMDRRYERQRSAVAHVVELSPPNGDGVSCSMAKDQRDDWERRNALNRNVDSLRWWQEFVARDCR